jgi:hypothetical protein
MFVIFGMTAGCRAHCVDANAYKFKAPCRFSSATGGR